MPLRFSFGLVFSRTKKVGQGMTGGRVAKVLIVGGGFGGLAAARRLGSCRHVVVQLVDRENHHLFQPLLYQVAMAGLGPAEIAAPIRGILSQHKNVEVLLGQLHSVSLGVGRASFDLGEITFDYLILACGAEHSYFGHDAWQPFAPGLKSITEATDIRRRVLLAFELAERESDMERRRALLTFVVVGGGPTGVELAGALGEISRYTLSRDFRRIDPTQARVILIERGPRILSTFAPHRSSYATRALEKLGVQVWPSASVSAITAEGVQVGGDFLRASTVLWAAGVRAAGVSNNLGDEVQRDATGRVCVARDLSIPGYPRAFCVGDQARFDLGAGRALPGLAPVALQQGRFAAEQILRDLRGENRLEFAYFDRGQMATIGRRRAVLEVGHFGTGGVVAWLAWLFVHIYFLIGFKNRIFVFFEWAWHYCSYARGSRLIVGNKPSASGER